MSALSGDHWAYVDAEVAALVEAGESAERSAATFTENHQSHYLAPEVLAHRDVGSDDRPLFDFRLNVDLADDLASSEYPMDEIQDLASALRAEVAPK